MFQNHQRFLYSSDLFLSNFLKEPPKNLVRLFLLTFILYRTRVYASTRGGKQNGPPQNIRLFLFALICTIFVGIYLLISVPSA